MSIYIFYKIKMYFCCLLKIIFINKGNLILDSLFTFKFFKKGI